ncbi:DUF1565 domain-containing protein [Streptomyces capitiformicae]|uniref:DUF1565 domain-containing protein n=1 Tax=Streptomyces capitiformicae TaxID=2014920 RepID=A0A919GQE7_9ACTN|nr:DUF1565 domain-containing protein [Streptomyces capitiformicae]GHH89060.1 hypothetical protein GCM10017771_37190 [Streptomyces capitiformicae]
MRSKRFTVCATLLSVLAGGLVVLAGTTAHAATSLYVATNGDDANSGTMSALLRTIQRAVDLAQPGDTILIRGGSYAPTTNIQLLKSGTSSQPITMSGYNRERVARRRCLPASRQRRGPRGTVLSPRGSRSRPAATGPA